MLDDMDRMKCEVGSDRSASSYV